MSIQLLYNDEQNVILARLTGPLVDQTIQDVCVTLEQFVDAHPKCQGILDFTGVTDVNLSAMIITEKAQNKPIFRGEQRVIVAPTDLLYAMSRMFQLVQDSSDSGEHTEVVHTMQEAYDILGISRDDFASVT